jgi:hypothetical protein
MERQTDIHFELCAFVKVCDRALRIYIFSIWAGLRSNEFLCLQREDFPAGQDQRT